VGSSNYTEGSCFSWYRTLQIQLLPNLTFSQCWLVEYAINLPSYQMQLV
jgi:hypothetical protein